MNSSGVRALITAAASVLALARPAAAQESVRIGLHTALSGGAAQMGIDEKSGVDMAVEELNKAGGLKGKRVELVYYDDEGKPDTAANVAQKLISQGVVGIVGSPNSANNLAVGPVAEAAKIPYVANGTLVKTTKQGWKYTVRAAVSDTHLTYSTADYLVRTAKYKRIAIIHEKDAYGAGYAEGVAANIKTLGGQIVDVQSYSRGDRDFAGQLLKIREAKPDVIVIGGLAAESAGIARQVRKLFTKPVALQGTDVWGQPETVKLAGPPNSTGLVYNNTVCTPENADPVWQGFRKAYVEKNKREPTVQATKGYLSVMLIAKGVKDADSFDATAVRGALARIKGWRTPLGAFTMDEYGDGLKDVVMNKVVDEEKRVIVYKNF
jgi:branched-chain amino acid transport system substrate-binding protein